MTIWVKGDLARPSPRNDSEPIAVIGMACRFPKAPNIAAFWRLLCAGVDAITEVPRDRFDAAALYDHDVFAPGKLNSRWGGFLDQIDLFDPLFFGISPKEAVQIDPQQRLLLELSWEALEDAGIPPDTLRESRTGVYFGLMWLEYFMLLRLGGLSALTQHTVTGSFHSFAANRVSYALGLQGPSLAVDSASSASLVAVHLACESLRRGESKLALAGGASLMLLPDAMLMMSKTGALSPDGRCHAFDARANGYVRGEGGGVVVLKPLAAALSDRDPIYCVIRGSAVNNDGASDGFSAPNPRAQEALLRDAYQRADIAPCDVDYVEAHGTGTALGDPIEAGALARVMVPGRPAERQLVVGSVKTNIGHLEAAAGIAGFIKTALCLTHRAIPANLHFQSRNPQVPESLRVPSMLIPWPAPERNRPATAGVSSFGLGGTNAHVVLQEPWPRLAASPRQSGISAAEPLASAPPQSTVPEDAAGGPQASRATAPPYILPLSARSEGALTALAREYHDLLSCSASASLPDIAYSAGARRSHHPYRLAVVAETQQECLAALAASAQGETPPGLVTSRTPTGSPPKVVFVFSGQGAQWLGMGRQLLAEEPVFRAAIQEYGEAIRREAGWSLESELLADLPRSNIRRSDIMQPMVFAVAAALAALYKSWGIRPTAILGHSMGEVAAAYTAGALSLADAVRIICGRSSLMQRMHGQGGVALVEAPLLETQQLLTGYGDRVSVAGSNSPSATMISGEADALTELLARLQKEGVSFRRVRMDVASHSAQMDPLRDDLLRLLAGIRPGAPHTAMYSTVTTEAVTPGMLDAAYWWRNLREPVLFWPTIERLREQECDVFLELSPHPILIPAIQEGFSHTGGSGMALGTLRREQPERRCLLEAVGALYVRGQDVDWEQLYPGGGQYVSLPTYPFQRERYWITDNASLAAAPSDHVPPAWGQTETRRPAEYDLRSERLFATAWRKLEARPERRSQPPEPGTWLVFMDRQHAGLTVIAALRSTGLTCIQVEPGDRFAQLGQDRYQLDPRQPTDYLALLRAAGRMPGEFEGIVHLWSLDGQSAEQTTAESLTSEQSLSSLSVIYLVQALLKMGGRKLPRLWLVLRATQAVVAGDTASMLSQTPLWGLSQALTLEYPELLCAAVDLSASASPEESDGLLNLMLSPCQENLLALRGSECYVPRILRSPPGARPGGRRADLRTDGAYLISGGLSRCGLLTAQWLAELGARHLILVDACEPESRHQHAIQRIQAAGTTVLTRQTAAADSDSTSALLAELRMLGQPLCGVISAAVEPPEAPARKLDVAAFQQVLSFQMQAAWNLHSLTWEDPLDFFICHCLAAPALSSSHLAGHLAATSFLAALAQYRQHRGRPAQTISWSGFPAAAHDDQDRSPLRPGLQQLTAEEGRELFRLLLRGSHACVAVMPPDVRQLFDAQPRLAASGLWAELLRERNPQVTVDGQGVVPLREALRQAPPADRGARLEAYLANKLGQVLRLDPARIDRQTPFKQLGLDSLMSFELRSRLETGTGVKLTSVVLFTYPNLAALTKYLHDALQLGGERQPAPASPPPASSQTKATEFDQLSDDELVARLSKKLLF